MNCLSNLKFTSPAFTLIRVHPRPSAVQNLPGMPERTPRDSVHRSSLFRFRPFGPFRPFPALAAPFPQTLKFHQTTKIYGPDNVQ
jgi:hypothetical protein